MFEENTRKRRKRKNNIKALCFYYKWSETSMSISNEGIDIEVQTFGQVMVPQTRGSELAKKSWSSSKKYYQAYKIRRRK